MMDPIMDTGRSSMTMMPDCNCSMPMMMQMTFRFTSTLVLLFDSWNITSDGELVAAIFAVFFLAIFYEGLKTFREYLIYLDMKRAKTHEKKGYSSLGKESEDSEDRQSLVLSEPPNKKRKIKGFKYYSISASMHILQSVLHVIQVGIGYLLMLVAMTYNGWLFLAVCFGAGVGYFLFAKSRHLMGNFREKNEHCH